MRIRIWHRAITYYILPTTYYLLLTTYYLLLPITYYLPPTTYYLLPTTYYILPTTPYLLPITTYYLLRTTYYVLPTAYYILHTTYYLLPTTYYYLLPTTHHLLPTSKPSCRASTTTQLVPLCMRLSLSGNGPGFVNYQMSLPLATPNCRAHFQNLEASIAGRGYPGMRSFRHAPLNGTCQWHEGRALACLM